MITPAARVRWLCLLLVLLGFAVSGYLLYRSFLLMADAQPAAADICSEVFGAGCDATLLDSTSWVLGIPLAGWGVVYYAALAGLLIMALALGDAFSPAAMLAALLISLAGLTNSVVLSISMLSGASPFCPLCAVVHFVNLLLVPCLFWAAGRRVGELLRDMSAAFAYACGRRAEEPTEAAWRVVGLVTAALVALAAYQWVYVQVTVRQAMHDADERPEDVLDEFIAQAQSEIPLSAEDIRLGPADAPATLVVFSDFQCPHCARAAKEIVTMQQRYSDELAIVFKHYPLSNVCNSKLKTDFHPRSCALAWGAEAAHRQGKFWAFHDAAFAAKGSSFDDAAIEQFAADAGLDMQQFDNDHESTSVKEKVQADIVQGHELGVRGTPSGFLNGRRVPSLAGESLEILIEHELHPRR